MTLKFPRHILPLFLILTISAPALAFDNWKQIVEIQPALERGASTVANPKATPAVEDRLFSSGAAPKWIWGDNNDASYVLSKSIELSSVKAARLKASCDNVGAIYINGKRVAGSSEWQEPMDATVTSSLKTGRNIIEAEVSNEGGIAAFVFKLVVIPENGSPVELVSDETWMVATKRDEPSTVAASGRGDYGGGPWGPVFDNAAMPGRVPAGVFETLPEYQVEKLFTVPRDVLGSWVCIAFDNKGRLLASDQGDLGICRITVPRASTDSSNSESETVVERLDFSKCQFQPSGAQGMLWAFDSLYLSVNGGPGSGLYRAKDLDGDDQFDECVRLKEFAGGGEHGPHSIRLSPDGKRIFVIAGNHTLPPFKAGEEANDPGFTSRVPTVWNEDHLLKRMWDANGHAVGILAPGGWIASTDPDGKSWDIWSIGYRNPYDMAFNADGELFAYDADMEWDVGTPWYRPTRVVHATSGSEFGWRSGSGKWPVYYQDSLPQLVNIGPGSPVGVDFGYGLSFPGKYQKCLYICDWTFGTMYAIHMEPHQSTYTATKEEFLSRTPLPLTDVAAGPDGLLYFSIGGRGTQSELFRVRYIGEQDTSPTNAHEEAGSAERANRKKIEEFHAVAAADARPAELSTPDLISALDGNDRQAVMSAMRAIQFTESDKLKGKNLPLNAELRLLTAMVTQTPAFVTPVAAEPEKDASKKVEVPEKIAVLRTRVNEFLRANAFNAMSTPQKLETLRLVSLAGTRLGMQTDDIDAGFRDQCALQFPSDDAWLNRELCQMLVYLKSPGIAAKVTTLMAQQSTPTVTDDMQDLLARNRGYGGAIAASLANAPDQQQTWYAFCLRNLKDGWTMEDRKLYFSWFERAHQWQGGASYHGFLRNIEQEAYENASEKERLLIEASGARKPYAPPELPKPAGPGKEWTLEEVRTMAESGLKDRNFENGQMMFAATRCVLCHRFAGEGGATGPDLTQLAGRFNLKDLTEAILDPSKVISDQYRGSTVVTTSGSTISGRIVADHGDSITVLTNPEDSTKVTEIQKSEIEELLPSSVSIMPNGLLKPLNQDEVLDLLAYLLSRGDRGNGMFSR
ncbi:MAG: c-type cytochrome [Planctomyces sp.]|nr:c-type cytochrome [Planctomyces sp.]